MMDRRVDRRGNEGKSHGTTTGQGERSRTGFSGVQRLGRKITRRGGGGGGGGRRRKEEVGERSKSRTFTRG